MSECRAYVLAWVPSADDPLGAFGRDWTGRCSATGERTGRALAETLAAVPADSEIMASGLIGELSVRFTLPPDVSIYGLIKALETGLDRCPAFDLPAFRLTRWGGTLSQVGFEPVMTSLALRILTDEIERAVGQLRDPRRRGAPQKRPGRRINRRGGSRPFRVPIAGPLAAPDADRVCALLSPHLERAASMARRVSHIALFGDLGSGVPLIAIEDALPLGSLPTPAEVETLAVRGPEVALPQTWQWGVSA
ncbi:MAG: hypothetical protein ACFBSD_15150 [Paracoccaceae bacterium]